MADLFDRAGYDPGAGDLFDRIGNGKAERDRLAQSLRDEADRLRAREAERKARVERDAAANRAATAEAVNRRTPTPSAPAMGIGQAFGTGNATDDLIGASPASRIQKAAEGGPRYGPTGPETPDTWAEFGRKAVERIVPNLAVGAAGAVEQIVETAPRTIRDVVGQMTGGLGSVLADVTGVTAGAENLARGLRDSGQLPGVELRRQALKDLEESAFDTGDSEVMRYAGMISDSVTRMAPSIAASFATRNPAVGAGAMFAQVSGEQYGDSRDKGRTVDEATMDAGVMGGAEAISEMIPLGMLMKPGGQFLGRTLKVAGAEALQEVFTQIVQTGYSAGVLKEDMTWGEAWQGVKDAAIVGAVVGGGLSVGVDATRGGAALLNRRPTAPGVREAAEATAATPTQADIDSPLPTELIVKGKADLARAEATPAADDILTRAGIPKVGARVTVTMPNGDVKQGAVSDAFETDAGEAGTSQGVKIALDDGTAFEEHFDTIADAGVVIAPAGRPASTPEGARITSGPAKPAARQSLDQVVDAVMPRIGRAESPNDTAKNPNSSAQGRYQFIDSTWLATYRAEFGDTGETPAQILAKKTDGALQDRLMRRFTKGNAQALERAGVAVDPGTLYLAHFAGAGGAIKLAKADPNAPVESVLGQGAVNANPFLKGKTVADTIAWAARKVGSQPGANGAATTTAEPDLIAWDDIDFGETEAIDPLLSTEADRARAPEPEAAPYVAGASPDGVRGEPINDDYSWFAPESGTLNIPRAEMPQIKAENRGAMVNFLNARGIAHEEQTIDPTSLQPTQAEFSEKKVQQAKDYTGGNRAILVSSDDRILDGHHQWMAARDDGAPIRVIRLDAPVAQLIDTVKEMPSVEAIPSSSLTAKDVGSATAEVPSQVPSSPIAIRAEGRADIAVTGTGRSVPVRYAVVEAADLIASNDAEGNANPRYPANLQPRDRTRAVSQTQVVDIAANLNPRLLGESPKASDGAPIISPEGVVESGNGRTLAVQRAYAAGGPQADAYRAFITEQGYDVEGVAQPVLVRVRDGAMEPADVEAFTREANARDTLGYSSTEQAMSDSAALPTETLDLYRGGDIDAAGNRDFVRSFFRSVVSSTDYASMIAADGTMSQQAVARVRGALLARAYGSDAIVAQATEATDSDIKSIIGALTDVAGVWGQMRTAAQNGTIADDVDLTGAVTEAVALVDRARREGRSVADLVGQTDMFGGSINPRVEGVLRLMFNKPNFTQPTSRKRLAETLGFIAQEALKAQPGGGLFNDVPPSSADDILALAERRKGTDNAAEGQPDLLAAPAAATERPVDPGERAPESGAVGDVAAGARVPEQRGEQARRDVATSSATVEDRPGGKSIIVKGATDAQLAAIKAAIPKASGLTNAKEGGVVFAVKYREKIDAALASVAPATPTPESDTVDLVIQPLRGGPPRTISVPRDAGKPSTPKTVDENGTFVRGDVAFREGAPRVPPRDFDARGKKAWLRDWDGENIAAPLPDDAVTPPTVTEPVTPATVTPTTLDEARAAFEAGSPVKAGNRTYTVTETPRGWTVVTRDDGSPIGFTQGGAGAGGGWSRGNAIQTAMEEVRYSLPQPAAPAFTADPASLIAPMSNETVDAVAGIFDRAEKRAAAKPNTLVTEDRAAELKARFKKKLADLGSTTSSLGIDPEMIAISAELAVYHIEKGARRFQAFAKAFAADLDMQVTDLRKYLRSAYNGARDMMEDAGLSVAGMDTPDEVATSMRTLADWADAAPAAPAPAATPNDERLDPVTREFRDRLLAGERFASITQARKIISDLTGDPVTPGTDGAKRADEAIEAAVVLAARQIAARGASPVAIYDQLVDLYARQPSLNVRTSTSIEQQAYSTPVPLAFLASQRAGIGQNTTVYEPSAGNGALLIDARATYVTANELNPDRAAALRTILPGAKITEGDALATRTDAQVDVVIGNPPFGPIQEADGSNRVFEMGEGYQTREIDHAISLVALDNMKNDGRAVLIVGSIPKTVTSDDARSNAYNAKAKREFYLRLYSEYNVTDHFTVAGELYSRQGAAWPVDVIVIEGRGKSALRVPAADVPRQYASWDALKDTLNGRPASAAVPTRQTARIGADVAAGSGATGGDERGAGNSGGQRPDRRLGLDPDGQPGDVRGGPADGQSGGAQLDVPARQPDAAPADAGAIRGDRPAPVKRVAAPIAGENARQVAYAPASGSTSLGTLVPVNMQTATRTALDRLQERVGAVDTYVADKLGYDPKKLGGALAAEQIDAVALAIDNMERGAGFIIGDQTGIGKGRVVAAVIRYAIRQGRRPIFVTEKPNLYGDMYRDLNDIELPAMLKRPVRILMTNAGETVPLDDSGENVLKTPGASKHNAHLRAVANGAGDQDVIFTTYSQMQSFRGESTERQEVLRAMAPGAILIFDESHNAGGQGPAKKLTPAQEAADVKIAPNRAQFARELAAAAHGVFYSSATYAKRPDVMDLYASTDMRLAVADIEKLGEAIAKGGIPMQQVVAANLAEAGQYVRRERSFDGITYDTPTVPVERGPYSDFTIALQAIQTFSEAHVASAVKDIDRDVKAEGKSISGDGSVGGAGASSTNFTAIMHNLIDQLLLAVKAGPAAERAIENLRAGKKVVLTVSNTMASFMEEFVAENGIAAGQPIDLDFRALLQRYLERTRILSIRKPFSKDKAVKHRLTDGELGPQGVFAFREAQRLIDGLAIAELPISPIDAMRAKIIAAGFKVGEITGRSATIDYSRPGAPIFRRRPASEGSIAGRRKAISGFNGGTLDAMILNQAGSTGLSLHASKDFKDKKPRHMIIVQAEKNIDVHMQMLGRVHRSGQVVLPSYDQLTADVPAEKRPTAILAKKMASLNANTTGARDSALTSDEVPDFINDYGDEIAARMMEEDPELHARLTKPLKENEKGEGLEREGAARKVTGRLVLLPLDAQEAFYDSFLTEFRDYLAQKDAAGESAMEAKTLPLDARTVSSQQVIAPTQAGSPFGEAVNVETVDVKRLGKPYSAEQVLEQVAETIGSTATDGTPTQRLNSLAVNGRNWMGRMADQARTAFVDYRRGIEDDIADDARLTKTRKRNDETAKRFTDLARVVYPGGGVRLESESGAIYGVVTKIEKKGAAKNPLALGTYRATIALADSARQVVVPFSQMDTVRADGGLYVQSRDKIGDIAMLDAFEGMQRESREERTIITGNILAGFDHVGGKGQIVNFVDDAGDMRQGIMMPRDFDYAKSLAKKDVEFRTTDQVVEWVRRGKLATAFGVTVTSAGGTVTVETPASKSTGGKFFLNTAVRLAVGGDFVKSGNVMRATAPVDRLPGIVRALRDDAKATFVAKDDVEEARALIGEGVKESRTAQTETAAFKRWFGDSKVVDADGEPLVVYHGAPDARFMAQDATFKGPGERFFGKDDGDGAFWFTPSIATARGYADDRRAFDYQAAEPDVIPAYLAMSNPMIVLGGGRGWREAQARGKTRAVIDDAREGGYDGVIIRNVRDDYQNGPRTKPIDTYVVFASAQIKSAIGNNGNFDPANPSILESRAADTTASGGDIEAVRADLTARLADLGIDDKVEVIVRDVIGPNIAGRYSPRGVLEVALDTSQAPMTTLNHEAIHAMRPLFRPAEWAVLAAGARSDAAMMASVRDRYPDLSPESQIEEAVADRFARFADGNAERGPVARAFERVMDFIRALGQALRGQGFTTPESVMRAIEGGAMAGRTPETVRAEAAGLRLSVTATPDAHTFDDEATETRFKEATKGLGTGDTLILRTKMALGRVANGFARHWADLPNLPVYADLQQKLRNLEAAPTAARERAVRMLTDMVKGFDRADLDLLARKVILDDLQWEAGQDHELPFGLTPDTLTAERAKVDAIIAAQPDQKVRNAAMRRKVINRAIANELVAAGVLDAERVKNPAYFRHQVLEYARLEQKIAASGKSRLRSPMWAKRMGSSLDINANLLEAEFDWLAKALTDIPTANAIDWIKKSDHNLLPELQARARDANAQGLAEAIRDEGDRNGEITTADREARQSIGRGFAFVAERIDDGSLTGIPQRFEQAADDIVSRRTGGEPPFGLLSWILDNDMPGAMGAAMVLKGIAGRRAVTKKAMGRRYVDPQDAEALVNAYAKDTHTTWQPDEGKLLFTVKTIPEHVIDAMLEKVATLPGIDSDTVQAMLASTRSTLALGGDKYKMILPDEVAATLNKLRRDDVEGILGEALAIPVRYWKRWVLINPRRVIKYNLNNLTGDIDAVIAGNPRLLRRTPEAAMEVARVMRNKAAPSARYQEAIERGVFDSGLSIQEIPDINALSAFSRLSEPQSLRPDKLATAGLGAIWRGLQGFTQWRENVFRYAAYLDYADRIEAGEAIDSIGYGASVPQMVDAVTDTKDKAALLARDLIGDYGAISENGAWLRTHLIPFWSWMEMNTKRYWRLSRNAYGQGVGKGLATSGGLAAGAALRGTATTAMLGARMVAVMGLISLWNWLFFDDEEQELSEQQQRQLHLVLGRNSDGQVVTLRTSGALSDVLGTFGFMDAWAAIEEVEKGRKSVGDVLAAPFKAMINRVGTSGSPAITLPIEAATGKKLWPDLFNTRENRDPWRNLFSTFSLENEYDAAMALPSRGYARSWVDGITYRRDPGEIAYDEARGLAYDWNRRVKGQEGSSSFSTPRSEAMRRYKTAIRYDDAEARDVALDDLVEFGMTDKELTAAMKRAQPLGPIAKKDRAEFLDSLTDEELLKFERAEVWYESTYR